jgi:uncharacterized membrane protein
MAGRNYHPIDHPRANRPRAGMVMKDTSELPGLILLGLAVIAVMFCLRFAAFGNDRSAIEAGVIAIFAAVVGSVWMFVARRRFTRIAQRSAVESEPPVAGPSGAP